MRPSPAGRHGPAANVELLRHLFGTRFRRRKEVICRRVQNLIGRIESLVMSGISSVDLARGRGVDRSAPLSSAWRSTPAGGGPSGGQALPGQPLPPGIAGRGLFLDLIELSWVESGVARMALVVVLPHWLHHLGLGTGPWRLARLTNIGGIGIGGISWD
jgi:hypothetical protein